MNHISHFDKVMDFNEKFGVKVYKDDTINIFIDDPKLVELRMDLIREEIKELEESIKNKDLVETIDALADILYVVLGMGCSLNINLNEVSNKAEFDTKYIKYLHPRLDIFDKEPLLIISNKQIISENMSQLEQAVKNQNLRFVEEVLSGIIYAVFEMSCSIGVNLNLAFDIVHNSNMSKLCESENKAIETVIWYEQNKEKLGYDSPTFRISEDKKYYVVFNKSSGKILKSIDYSPANFKSLF